jgi:predicted aminopeptidase
MNPSIRSISVLFAAIVPSLGCQVDYLAHLALGEINSLSHRVPLDQALLDQSLSADEREKLTLSTEIRAFAIDRIGLTPREAFTVFEANGQTPAAFVITACAKESFSPYLWDFPFIGHSRFKGFFDEAFARREADFLAWLGFDVYLARADGFSTLGAFPDAIRQSNLRMDQVDLAEFLLHEMTHATVFKPSDNDFNESMATFVGRRAAQDYFDDRFGDTSSEAVAARDRFADKSVIDEYVETLYSHMSAYYQSAADQALPRDSIIAGREIEFAALRAMFENDFQPRLNDPAHWQFILDSPLDNARILAGYAYQADLSDYARVLDQLGGVFSDALAVFAEAAKQADSRAFLRNWSPP